MYLENEGSNSWFLDQSTEKNRGFCEQGKQKLDSRCPKRRAKQRKTEMMSGRLRNVAAQWKSMAKEAVDRTLIVAKFLCFLHVTNTYVCTPCLVHGPSMLPTLNITGDVILVERISTRLEKVAPGDIVLVRSPENPKKLVTKRVLGMEGDRVTFVVDPNISDRYESVIVPKGHVWIQGDNIYASHDSRQFGPVPYGLLLGKAFYRIWPPDGFGSLGRGE